jgi:hypothetical protein
MARKLGENILADVLINKRETFFTVCAIIIDAHSLVLSLFFSLIAAVESSFFYEAGKPSRDKATFSLFSSLNGYYD